MDLNFAFRDFWLHLKGAAAAMEGGRKERDRFLLKRNDNVLLMRIMSRGGAFKGTASSLQVYFSNLAPTLFLVKKETTKCAMVVTPV